MHIFCRVRRFWRQVSRLWTRLSLIFDAGCCLCDRTRKEKETFQKPARFVICRYTPLLQWMIIELHKVHEFFSPFIHPIISGKVTHQSRWDPSLPGDLTYLDTDNTVVSTTNSLSHLLTQTEKSSKPTDSNWDSVEKSGMCFGNRTQRTSNSRFQGKYSYHTDLPENPERPHSPNVLPMSQCYWCVGFFGSVNLSVFWGN